MGWRKQGVAGRSEMHDLLQQVEDVKQLAQLLSRRSATSGNESGARHEKSTIPLGRRAGNRQSLT